MAVITPVGKFDFDWVPKDPKEEMVRTASSNEESAEASTEQKPETKAVEAKSDKDLLYEAAKKVVEAQFDDTEVEDDDEGEEGGEEGGSDEAEEAEEAVEEAEEAPEGAAGDVQDAVAELVEKAEAADELAEAVGTAVEAVEEAVEGIKSVVGGGAAEAEEGVEELPMASEDAIVEVDVVDEEPSVGGEDIVIESEPEMESECCGGAFAKSDKDDLKKEAGADQFVKISKISPTTKKKVLKFWKDDLGYVADYAKLMTTNYEK